MTARVPKLEEREVVVKLTNLVTVSLRNDLERRWKATCPLCKDLGRRAKPIYALTRKEAETRLHEHLKTHELTQGSLL